MFLFVSKLLPLFFYPLGISCLLLIGALILMWRRPRSAAVSIALALLILFLSSSVSISDGLVRSLEFQNIPGSELPNADAIVVLGGSTESALPPRPWVEIREEGDRVLYAAKLYRDGKAPKVILSGGRIIWNREGASESQDMATLIETMSVPPSAILQDPSSLNTRENAVNVKQIMDAQGIRQVLLVTSAMHMPRSLRIFRKLGVNAIAAPTDFTAIHLNPNVKDHSPEAALLNALPDAEQLRRTTRALKEYVGILVYWLRGWI